MNKKAKEAIERRCTELWEQRRGGNRGGNPLAKALQTGAEALDATTQQMLRIMQAVAVQGGSKMKAVFEKTLTGWTAVAGE